MLFCKKQSREGQDEGYSFCDLLQNGPVVYHNIPTNDYSTEHIIITLFNMCEEALHNDK